MSNEKEIPSDAPPVYPNPTAYPEPTSPGINQRSTAPAPAPVGQQYPEPLYASCATGRGHHEPTTKFGTCGIITAIFCFPIGLLCLCADKETRCARCGALLY